MRIIIEKLFFTTTGGPERTANYTSVRGLSKLLRQPVQICVLSMAFKTLHWLSNIKTPSCTFGLCFTTYMVGKPLNIFPKLEWKPSIQIFSWNILKPFGSTKSLQSLLEWTRKAILRVFHIMLFADFIIFRNPYIN